MAAAKAGYRAGSSFVPVTLAICVIVVCAGTALAIVVYNQVKVFRAEIFSLKRELAATKEQIIRLEKRLPAPANAPRDRVGEPQSFRLPAVHLDSSAADFIRSIIVVPPAPPGALPSLTIGSHIPESALLAMPEPVAERFPKLRGMMVTTDRDGAIVLVGRDSRRVEFIIPAR
jgi:hypothetical protein